MEKYIIKLNFGILLIILSSTCFCQSNPKNLYFQYIQKADSFYFLKDYKNSHINYSLAFISSNDVAYVKDRYNAACSWALDNSIDSAFYQLFRIALKGKFNNYENIINDIDLISLRQDKRWDTLLNIIKANK